MPDQAPPDAGPETSLGPNVVNQTLIASTCYGHVVRCGCGWRAIHSSESAARGSGERHVWTAHGTRPPSRTPKGDAAA